MPKVSFYLRNEDVDSWKAIEKKTEWIHQSLDYSKQVDQFTIGLQVDPPKYIPKPDMPVIGGGKNVIIDMSQTQLCKKHSLPVLPGRTICGQKDCK